MTGRRICRTLPVGSTITDRQKTTWQKVQDTLWEAIPDGRFFDEPVNNAAMDIRLADGGEIVRLEVGLETEPVLAKALEVGEYVAMSFGWWSDSPGENLFDPANPHVGQQLWRVAGWTNNTPQYLTVLLDAPEDLLRWVNHLNCPEGGWDARAFEHWVRPEDVFHVVLPGQEHERWDGLYDWSYEFTLVDPPLDD